MKSFLSLLFLLLMLGTANAQYSNVQLCTPVTSGGVTTCTPVSAANPFPMTVGTSAISGVVPVANGGTGISNAPILFDSFQYANQSGLQTPNTGIPYFVTGAGAASIAVSGNAWVSNNVTYVVQYGTQYPYRIGGKFAWTSSDSGASSFTMISSEDNPFSIQDMIHLVVTTSGVTLSWWTGGTNQGTIPCNGNQFPSSLLQNGTVYSVYMDISPSTNTVVITDPFGQQLTCSNSNISTLSGNTTVWEETSTTLGLQKWYQLETYPSYNYNVKGTLTATAGLQGPLGNITPSPVYTDGFNLTTTQTYSPAMQITTNPTGTVIDTINATVTNGYPTLRLKAVSGGYGPIIWLDEGQTNPNKIYSAGNAQDIRFSINNADIMVMPFAGGIGIGTSTPKSTLDISGGVSVGTSYAGHVAAPTNGEIIQGNVGIGTTAAPSPLTAFGLASGAITSDFACYDTANGEFTYQTSNCTASLRAAKDEIEPLAPSVALDEVLRLKPSTFYMKNERGLGREIGLIAEDVEGVDPRLAVYDEKTHKLQSVQYDRTGILALAAIQQQQEEIDELCVQMHLPSHKCNMFCKIREFWEGL